MEEEKQENKKEENKKADGTMKEEIKNQKTEEKEESEEKAEGKKEEKKKEKKKEIKKDKAEVNGKDLGISKKHSMAICKFIKNKNIEKAIEELEQVIKLKKAVPMKGEIPHRKGMERGRYPVNASKGFIKLLKSLNANCQVNNMENVYIFSARADKAPRPYRRFGSRRFKRTHIYLEARERKVKGESKLPNSKARAVKKGGVVSGGSKILERAKETKENVTKKITQKLTPLPKGK